MVDSATTNKVALRVSSNSVANSASSVLGGDVLARIPNELYNVAPPLSVSVDDRTFQPDDADQQRRCASLEQFTAYSDDVGLIASSTL